LVYTFVRQGDLFPLNVLTSSQRSGAELSQENQDSTARQAALCNMTQAGQLLQEFGNKIKVSSDLMLDLN